MIYADLLPFCVFCIAQRTYNIKQSWDRDDTRHCFESAASLTVTTVHDRRVPVDDGWSTFRAPSV